LTFDRQIENHDTLDAPSNVNISGLTPVRN
jgi:hypothetical protein